MAGESDKTATKVRRASVLNLADSAVPQAKVPCGLRVHDHSCKGARQLFTLTARNVPFLNGIVGGLYRDENTSPWMIPSSLVPRHKA